VSHSPALLPPSSTAALPARCGPTLAVRSRGAYLLVAGRGALAGHSAAELLGARIAPRDAEAEVVTPDDLRACRGLRVHREQLAEDEVETAAGLVLTSAIRTAYDLARWLPLVEGVVAADALARRRRFALTWPGTTGSLHWAGRYYAPAPPTCCAIPIGLPPRFARYSTRAPPDRPT
jgi:hypothetical protein